MIKFFRKIRQRLLSENKLSKYLIYAIGEIILVVIGILIALQINNMNENKKARDYEKKMLIEIKNALVKDVDFFNNHLVGNRLQRIQNASRFFENYLVSNSIHNDSIDYHFNGLSNDIQITYNKGPFEALKSTGIDRISNDSLRNKIINLYEFGLPRQTGLIRKYMDNFISSSKKHENQLRVNLHLDIKNGKVSYIFNKMKKVDLKTNQSFLTLLSWASVSSNQIIGLFNSITPEMNQLIKEIDKELQE